MSKLMIEMEILHLQDIEPRKLTFPNGEEHIIELCRIHWLWFDRFPQQAGRSHFTESLLKGLPEDAAVWEVSLSEAMKRQLEDVFREDIERGDDPYETRSEEMLRKSAIWKFKQAQKAQKAGA